MELKVICDCGQKLKFDVEPVDGKVPFAVICPVCQADDTGKANELLATQSMAAASPLSIASPPVPSTEAATISPPPAIAPMGGGLRISRPAQTEPAPVAAAPLTAGGDPPPPAIGAIRPFAVATAANPPKKTSFVMGLVGGLVGAMVGGMFYFLIFNYTGLRFSILALGVGALAGWLAELLGKGEGSKELGVITAVLALAAVMAAQYLVALSWYHEATSTRLTNAQSAYANAVIEANEVVKTVPTGSDAEIRSYLAKAYNDDGGKTTPAEVPADEVKDFHDNQLPEYQALASGQVTKEQYEQAHEIKTSQTKEDEDADDGTVKLLFIKLLVTRANIFALVAAAALAFRLSTNA